MKRKSSSKLASSNYHLGIDARAVTSQPAGKGRYVLGLLEGWTMLAPADQLLIFGPPGLLRDPVWPSHWEVIEVPPSLRGSLVIDRLARKRGVETLIAPSNYSLGVVAKTPTVTIVHDIAVFVVPEARPSLKVRLAERLLLGRCLQRSRKVMAVSEFTRQELIHYFHTSPAKIGVAPNAVDHHFQPSRPGQSAVEARIIKRYDLPKNFLLFVSTLEPRKNLVRLLEAYEQLPNNILADYPLLLVGRLGWSTTAILAKLQPLLERGLVRQLDYVAGGDLPLLYQLATVVVFPSLYEGFGLPALEAMASGTPLLTSNVSALPEVVGEAALLINPLNTRAILGGLTNLITDQNLRKRLREKGLQQAAKFTWLQTAQALRLAVENLRPQS